MQNGSLKGDSVKVKFYEHQGPLAVTVHVHAKRVGTVTYRNKVNIYKVEKGKGLGDAKLTMYGITIRTAQGQFNLGEVKLNPGDQLYSEVEKRGLEFTAVPQNKTIDHFKTYFE